MIVNCIRYTVGDGRIDENKKAVGAFVAEVAALDGTSHAMPTKRMGPPPRSFAADAQNCIVVQTEGSTAYKLVARSIAHKASSPPIAVSNFTANSEIQRNEMN